MSRVAAKEISVAVLSEQDGWFTLKEQRTALKPFFGSNGLFTLRFTPNWLWQELS